MKKTMILSTLLATSLLFVGCTKEEKKEEGKADNPKTEEVKKKDIDKKPEKRSELTQLEALEIAKDYFKSHNDELGFEVEKEPKKMNNETYYKARLYAKTMNKQDKNGTIDHVYIGKKGVFNTYDYEKTGKMEFYHFSLQK